MSKHFSSVLRVTEAVEAEGGKRKVTVNEDRKTVALTQPHPLSCEQQPIVFSFDRIYSAEEDDNALYKHSIKEVVESTLLGYHGTVLFFGSPRDGSSNPPRTAIPSYAISKAASQMFRCLKKSKRSKSQSVSNLVVLSSFVMIIDENVHDLLHGFLPDGGSELVHEVVEIPKLSFVNGTVIRASIQKVNTTSEAVALLKYGSQMEGKILQAYGRTGDQISPHHSVFTLTVEYAQFGSMNSPISGNLSFVNIGTAGPLVHRQKFTTGDKVDKSVISLFTFADIVNSLTPSSDMLQGNSGSVFDLDSDTTLLPCVPTTLTSELYDKSTLTQLLKEALGGNCKTLLICQVPEMIANSCYSEVYESLKIASRARVVQNNPNKRDLAEKALMSAYMKELQLRYGDVWMFTDEEKKTESVTTSKVAEKEHDSDSILSDDIDATYDQLIDMTAGEQRKRNVEMAATALVAAALAGGGEESEEEVEDEEEDSEEGADKPKKVHRRITLKKKKRKQDLKGGTELNGSCTTALEPWEVTVDALVGILQDPDRGVPRALTTALRDVKIRRDKGALFSGADIVWWMVENVVGVEGEEDAEKLGQLLLDKGAIFHSEGSKVFASAETLFYYAKRAKPTSKPLSREEIKALLAQTTAPTDTPQPPEKGERGSSKEGQGAGSTDNQVTAMSGAGRDTNSGDDELHIEHSERKNSAVPIPISTGSPIGTLSDDQPLKVTKSAVESLTKPGALAGGKSFPPSASSAGADIEISDLDEACPNGLEDPNVSDEDLEGEQLPSERAGEPNTAPVERMPSIHTLESAEEYPHPLHMAVAIGKHPGVIKNLVMMFGVDKCDDYNRTPLMFAVKGNKRASCTTLIDCGADVNRQDSSGLTALHVACYHGNRVITNVLLSTAAVVDIRDKMGHSALHWSTVPANHSCLQLVVSRALPDLVECVDRSGLTALHWAIYYDHPQHLKLLLKKYQNQLQLDSEGRTLMTYAIQRHAAKCMEVLLTMCPPLLALPDSHGGTPLHYTSTKNSPEYIQLLLLHKLPTKVKALDVDCRDQFDRTPLHCAVACNRPQNVKILIGKGAQVNVVDNEGRSPADYARGLAEGSEMIAILEGDTLNCINSSEPSKSKVCRIL